jgi:hypothetical protein
MVASSLTTAAGRTRTCAPSRPARCWSGSTALSLCTIVHPLYTRFTRRFDTSISETTTRPNSRCSSTGGDRRCGRGWRWSSTCCCGPPAMEPGRAAASLARAQHLAGRLSSGLRPRRADRYAPALRDLYGPGADGDRQCFAVAWIDEGCVVIFPHPFCFVWSLPVGATHMTAQNDSIASSRPGGR